MLLSISNYWRERIIYPIIVWMYQASTHYLNHYWPMIVEMVSSGIHMTERNGQDTNDEIALKKNITTLFVKGSMNNIYLQTA